MAHQLSNLVVTGTVFVALAVAIASLVINIIILGDVQNPPPIIIQNENNSWHYTPAPQYNSTPGVVNNTNGYKEAATFLLDGLDDTVNPCEDFYAFTCNKYLQKIDLNKLQASRLSTYDQSQSKVYNQIKSTLSNIDATDSKVSKTERITKVAFDSCINHFKSETSAVKNVYDDLKKLFGGLPFLNEKLTDQLDLWKVAGAIEQKHAVGTLTYTIASSDYKNLLRNALYTGPPALSMPRDYYVKPQFVNNLNGRVSSVISMMQQFGLDLGKKVDNVTITQAAKDVVDFEVLIAMATWPDDLLRNYQQQYNPYNLSTAGVAYNSINWTSYLEQLYDQVQLHNTSLDQYNIVVTQPSYFAWLNNVFSGKTVDANTIANYMAINFIFDVADFIGSSTRQISENANYIHYAMRSGRGVTKIGKYEKRVFDTSHEMDFTEPCMSILTAYMPYGTGYVYVKSVPERNQVKSDVKVQTDLIIKNFQGMINTLQWMTDDSKNRAHNKSDSLIRNYGWPEDLFGDFQNFAVIDQYNQDYEPILQQKTFYEIIKTLKRGMEVRELFALLTEPAKRENFLQSPAMVNAWYQPERNSITFPYAIWNPPYYNLNYPQAYNYAGQGGTAGHELTHGYDDEGVQFGFNGELSDCKWNKCGWMDTSSSTGFINMAQCVVTQFSTQCCPEKTGNVHCANGATTQGENIADLGGQQSAYRAYREYVASVRNGVEEDRLPGLEYYTPNQIFWITYGYSWCMKQTDANLVNQLLTNPHSPAKCRVNQVMQDIPEFGRDFGCTRGSAMFPQPSNRCKVWVGQ